MIDPLEIQALVDGELSPKDAESVRARIAACKRSNHEFHTVTALKHLVSTKAESYTCEVTWVKCQGRLVEIDKARNIEGFVGRYAWGLCGAFAMVIAVGGYYTRVHHTGAISSEEVPRVAAGMISIPGVSKSVSGAREWLSHTLGRTAPVTLPEGAFQVVGLAKGSIDGYPVAKVRLHDNLGDADLLMVPGAQAISGVHPLQDGEFSVARVDGQSLVSWTRNGCAMMIVGPRPVEDLVALAAKVRVN